MAVEDIFNGAKSGLTFLNAYSNTVAQAIGTDQALALETTTCEALGAAQGMMIKEQTGVGEFDAKAASQVLANLIEEGFGILSEVVKESPQGVTIKVGRCPVYEAAQDLGMDAEAIEANCRATSIRFMDAITKQLNPNLSYQLTRFRSAADGYCEEGIVLA